MSPTPNLWLSGRIEEAAEEVVTESAPDRPPGPSQCVFPGQGLISRSYGLVLILPTLSISLLGTAVPKGHAHEGYLCDVQALGASNPEDMHSYTYPEAIKSKDSLVWGFVQDPDGRGTFSILLSCLAVLLLNTWTVLHLNIPPRRSPWRNYLHKCKWWIIALICPDGLAVSSFEQWRNARLSVKRLKAKYPWWTITHGFYAEMGGYRIVPPTDGNPTYTFRARELIWLAEHDVLIIPEVTSEELHDRSNADYLIKGIALTQSTWFMLQLCARVNQHLPITTLELATVAFIGCTGMMYFFWWHKPMDIEIYTPITDPGITSAQLCSLAREVITSHSTSHWYRPPPREAHEHRWDWFWFEKPMVLTRLHVIDKGDKVPRDLRAVVKDNFTGYARVASWFMPAVNESHSAEWGPWDHLCVFCVGNIFNGIHCAAWKFVFPTHIESVLWKVSVCTMLGVIYLWVPVAGTISWLRNRRRLKSVPYWFVTLCYFVARLYLIFEIFFGLRALEHGVFLTVDWTKYFPHA
ncbi:hypothetical protein H2200_000473 [Cladophialophora chaetospira]|uniref:Uncharacterized protein n=1 Tax=Cladophialophora chaetospira TaxID=386627 RepID=A0AA38XPI4_9EURO|nr:hypothetical protein H2200_000473 [Cladophialophora chaetospira]